MNPSDEQLIKRIQQATRGGARLLCTLARRGKALERDEPQRAALLLTVVSPHPLYKGGRLAFDMLELEDVMLDASIEPALSLVDLSRVLGSAGASLARLAEALMSFGISGREDAGARGVEVEETARNSPDTGGSPPAVRLPRVRLAPFSDPAEELTTFSSSDERSEAGESLPQLRSSDYLFDYVVLGFLDVLGRRIREQEAHRNGPRISY